MRKSEHAYHPAVGKKSALGRCGVYAHRKPGYDRCAAFCYLIAHTHAHFDPIRRCFARADNGYGWLGVNVGEFSLYIYNCRRKMNISKALGVDILVHGDNVDTRVIALFKYTLCSIKIALFKLFRTFDIARQQARYLADRSKVHFLGASVVFKKRGYCPRTYARRGRKPQPVNNVVHTLPRHFPHNNGCGDRRV